MKAKLSSGRQLSRAWRELRENAPVPGLGWLARQSHHGTTLHQRAFRMGYLPLNLDELTSEQQIQWRNANLVPGSLVGDARVGGTGGRAFVPPGRVWPGGKGCIVTGRTARMFADTACQTAVGTGVAAVNPSAAGLRVSARGKSSVPTGWASPTLRRRGAETARYPRADSARATRQRNESVGAGYGFDRQRTANGSVLSVARSVGHSFFGAIAGYVDGSPVQSSITKLPYISGGLFSGQTTSVAVRLYVLGIAQSGHAAHQSAVVNGVVKASRIYIRAIFERYGIDSEVLTYHLALPIPTFPDLADATTWAATPLQVSFTLDGAESSGWKLDVTHLGYLP